MDFQAYLPKSISRQLAVTRIDNLLKVFGSKAQKNLQSYPAARPWKNPPRTGLRAGGKRTGGLGRGWGNVTIQSTQSVTLTNKTPYAVYVEGPSDKKPGQTSNMAGRGWPSVTKAGKDALEETIRTIKDLGDIRI